ncbi:MAG: Yip1 family protein [Bacteroidota bacterium]|nr:Yip1 family protein [Bacteroidota bacterium]
MIICQVCNTENHHLAITCSSCSGYLQNKVEALDLFTTAWNVLEKPSKAFHTIAIAHHKNYVLFLSAITGIALTFFMFWIIKAGDYTHSLLNFLAVGFSIAPFLGIIFVFTVALLLKSLNSLMRVKVTFRNAFAVTAYSFIPIVISAILVLPIEIMTFGTYFFSKNPSPLQLKPLSYVLLLGLDGIFALWWFILFWIGLRRLTGKGWIYAGVMEVIVLAIVAGIFVLAFQYLPLGE